MSSGQFTHYSFSILLLRTTIQPDLVVQICDPNYCGCTGRRIASSGPAWATEESRGNLVRPCLKNVFKIKRIGKKDR